MSPFVCSVRSAKSEGDLCGSAASQYTAGLATIEPKTPEKTNGTVRSELRKQAHREAKKLSENG